MARRMRRVLPFRIPFFRIFYSTTYTVLFLLCLIFLAITPGTIMWRAFRSGAYQYIIMIGGVYFVTALISIFIYSSRLYTNRTTLADVGKAYIPIEEDEIGKSLRKLIVAQLQRSAIIAWEAKPRNLADEIARVTSFSPMDEKGNSDNQHVGTIVIVDPENPPWGTIRHDGWSPPSVSDDNQAPHVCYATVVEELPNLLEAKAVSLVPLIPDPEFEEELMPDPAVLELLARPPSMDLSTYVKQLSYIGLIRPMETGRTFLSYYQTARFSPRPPSHKEFNELMQLSAQIIGAMTSLDPAIVDEIRIQTDILGSESMSTGSERRDLVSRAGTQSTRSLSPVTARTRVSRNTTPYFTYDSQSNLSFTSVIHREATVRDSSDSLVESQHDSISMDSSAISISDAGSVVRRHVRH